MPSILAAVYGVRPNHINTQKQLQGRFLVRRRQRGAQNRLSPIQCEAAMPMAQAR